MMPSPRRRLWFLNADFETELSVRPGTYRRTQSYAKLNQRLAPHLLWLTQPGDGLLLSKPWSDELQYEAQKFQIDLFEISKSTLDDYLFTPWGWTLSAIDDGLRAGAIVQPPVPVSVIAQINSKLWSHALEVEMGWALPAAATASTFDEISEAVASGCPGNNDQWVIKSPFGFAARERVLGRGPRLEGPQATWCQRRLNIGETLIFQPWLEVIREYGVAAEIFSDGSLQIYGFSDLQTNGAGTGKGYLLGRPPSPDRRAALEETAAIVSARLFQEGYTGPFGIDALEHTGGFHRLLEINARYTMGFVAVAVEKKTRPVSPMFLSF